MANWIQNAIKNPGALTKKAKKAGGINKKTGNIKTFFIEKAQKSDNPTTKKQAILAKTLKKLNKK
jgi:hypothetical protein